jgi:hypothetical protein
MVTPWRVKPLFIDLFLICLDKIKMLFNKALSIELQLRFRRRTAGNTCG